MPTLLSRVADSLYWTGRYLERAEHTARLVDVSLNLLLDQAHEGSRKSILRLLNNLEASAPGDGNFDMRVVTSLLILDRDNPGSLANSIALARENCRQVREQVTSEMWELINRNFLFVQRATIKDVWDAQPHEFLGGVIESIQSWRGATDATMNHGEGFRFIQLGCFIERAAATTLLLDRSFRDVTTHGDVPPSASEYFVLVEILRACAAFESYCRAHTADLHTERIAEFLLLDNDFPRSVYFAAEQIHRSLEAISADCGTPKQAKVNRLAGRMRANLNFAQIDEILAGDLHTFLREQENLLNMLHNAFYQTYVAYPIESAIPA